MQTLRHPLCRHLDGEARWLGAASRRGTPVGLSGATPDCSDELTNRRCLARAAGELRGSNLEIRTWRDILCR